MVENASTVERNNNMSVVRSVLEYIYIYIYIYSCFEPD